MPPISSKVRVHAPNGFLEKTKLELIAARTQQINQLKSQTHYRFNLSTLSENDFYTFEQLILILDHNITQDQKKIKDASFHTIKHILSQLEAVADQFYEGEIDVLFEYYFDLRDSNNILFCLQNYPKLFQKMSSARLVYSAVINSSDVAEHILQNTALSKVVNQDNYARHKIYDAHNDSLYIADQAVEVFDISRIYKHDNDQKIIDKRNVPNNFQLINQAHIEKITLSKREAKLKNEKDNWDRLLKISDKTDPVFNNLKIKLNIQADTPNNQISSEYIKNQIKQLNQKIKANKIDLENKRHEILRLCQDYDISKRAFDIFLRKQDTPKQKDQSHKNMILLIDKLRPKYRTLIDQRHIEGMFALVKTEQEYILLFLYLIRDKQAKNELIKFLKDVAKNTKAHPNTLSDIQKDAKNNLWLYAPKLVTYETEKSYKIYANYPDVMQAMFEDMPVVKIAECLKPNQSHIDINDKNILNVLNKNAAWLTAEHLIAINKEIDHSNNLTKNAWRNYLNNKKGLKTLRIWAETTITNAADNQFSDLRILLENYPDLRRWLALGKIKQQDGTTKLDLMDTWVKRSNYDLEICRLVASDNHLFASYKEGNNAPQADAKEKPGLMYLNARSKFEREYKTLFDNQKGLTTLVEKFKYVVRSKLDVFNTYEKMIFRDDQKIIENNNFTQETAYVLLQHYWEYIEPVNKSKMYVTQEGQNKRVSNKKEDNLINKSLFFEAKIKNQTLIDVILDLDKTDTLKRAKYLTWMGESPLLFAEVIRSTNNDPKKLIALAKFIQSYQPKVREGEEESPAQNTNKQYQQEILKEINTLLIKQLEQLEFPDWIFDNASLPNPEQQYTLNIFLQASYKELFNLSSKCANKSNLTKLENTIDEALISKLSDVNTPFDVTAKNWEEATILKIERNVDYVISILSKASLTQLYEIEKKYVKAINTDSALQDKLRKAVYAEMIKKLAEGYTEMIKKLAEGTEVVPDEIKSSVVLDSKSSSTTASTSTATSSSKKKIRKANLDGDNNVDGSAPKKEKQPEKKNKDDRKKTVQNSDLKAYIESAILKKCTLDQLKKIFIKQPALKGKTKNKIIELFCDEKTTAESVIQFIVSINETEQNEMSEVFKDNTQLAEKILLSLSDEHFIRPAESEANTKALDSFFKSNPTVAEQIFNHLNSDKYYKNLDQYQKLIITLANIVEDKQEINQNLSSDKTEAKLAIYNPYVVILLNNDYAKYIKLYATNFTNIINTKNIHCYVDAMSSELFLNIVMDQNNKFGFVTQLYNQTEKVKTKILEKIIFVPQLKIEQLETLYKETSPKVQKERKLELLAVIHKAKVLPENKVSLSQLFNELIKAFNYLDIKQAFFTQQIDESQKINLVIEMLNSGIWKEKIPQDDSNFFADDDIQPILFKIFKEVNLMNNIDNEVHSQLSSDENAKAVFWTANLQPSSPVKKDPRFQAYANPNKNSSSAPDISRAPDSSFSSPKRIVAVLNNSISRESTSTQAQVRQLRSNSNPVKLSSSLEQTSPIKSSSSKKVGDASTTNQGNNSQLEINKKGF
jgi:hypothetical protein